MHNVQEATHLLQVRGINFLEPTNAKNSYKTSGELLGTDKYGCAFSMAGELGSSIYS